MQRTLAKILIESFGTGTCVSYLSSNLAHLTNKSFSDVCKPKSCQIAASYNSHLGKKPVNLFIPSTRNFSLASLPSSLGIGPHSTFADRTRCSILLINPSSLDNRNVRFKSTKTQGVSNGLRISQQLPWQNARK